jgi:hypothetical protein
MRWRRWQACQNYFGEKWPPTRQCCGAFDALGFAAAHLGGEKAPDGYADALLESLSCRTMIECKSSDEGVNSLDTGAARISGAYGVNAKTVP